MTSPKKKGGRQRPRGLNRQLNWGEIFGGASKKRGLSVDFLAPRTNCVGGGEVLRASHKTKRSFLALNSFLPAAAASTPL